MMSGALSKASAAMQVQQHSSLNLTNQLSTFNVLHARTSSTKASDASHKNSRVSKAGAVRSQGQSRAGISRLQPETNFAMSSGLRMDNCAVAEATESRRPAFVVSASPPTEEVVVQAERLTKEDLVNYLRSGCKPKEQWRLGTEHEKFGFYRDTLEPINYETIEKLLNQLAERYGWEKVMEGDKVIGLTMNRQSVSLEPGGQFELSGAPLETVHQTCAEVSSHLEQVKDVSADLGIGFLGLGFHPSAKRDDIPIMPKGRYDIMRSYMPKVGSLGLEMMLRTCTIQVNLDFESEADMVNKFRVGLALQPIATALFANSPFKEGKPNGFLSLRSHIWEDTDKDRTGDLPFVFEEGFGFERYVEYALSVPMYFVYRNKQYVDTSGLSFKDFMEGKLTPLPGEYPTLNDWENHLTTIFPEVRLKRYMEMRGADGGSWKRICALPAFWAGIMYDDKSFEAALNLISDWTELERATLRKQVPVTALQTPFRGGTVQDIAKYVLKLSKDGLRRRGFNESGFLMELEATAESGVTPAERMLQLYDTTWDQSVEPIFKQMLF